MATEDNARLNSTLALLRQAYDRIQSLGDLPGLRDLPDGPAREALGEDLFQIWHLQRRVRKAIAGRIAEKGLMVDDQSSELWRFYHETFLPDWGVLSGLVDDVFFAGLDLEVPDDTTSAPSAPDEDPERDPIDLAFSIGVDLVRNGFEDNFEWWGLMEDDVDRAELLESATFFSPGSWSRRLDELRPIQARRPIRNHPAHVRSRLREIGHSYIFGNDLSVIALSRSLLEYVLIDRGSSLGIDPYDAVDGRRRSKPLWELVELYEPSVPSLVPRMEAVRDHGNNAMHPSKHKDVIRFPEVLQRQALECVEAIRAVIEELYR